MKAYLINPFKREVTEVEYEGDYRAIYPLIQADCFDIARLDKGDGIYVDDNGLISGKHQEFFLFKDYPTPLAGYGLLLGSNDDGESTIPHLTFEQVQSSVTFLTNLEVMIGAKSGRW